MSDTSAPRAGVSRQTWTRAVEQLVLPALEQKIRVLGFTAPHTGAGVTSVAELAAETIARAGGRVLYIDFSNTASVEDEDFWHPEAGTAARHIQHGSQGYDRLSAACGPEVRSVFNNGRLLRRVLVAELGDYSAIVCDLPPITGDDNGGINPLSVALICDQVHLVCANAKTVKAEAVRAAAEAKQAGVKLTGLIWNEGGYPALGKAMADTASRRLGFFPALARFLERRFSRSPFLNG